MSNQEPRSSIQFNDPLFPTPVEPSGNPPPLVIKYKEPQYPLRPEKEDIFDTDTPGEDDKGNETVWQLFDASGNNYYSLRLGRRTETFSREILTEGWYCLRVCTPDLCTLQKFPLVPLEWRRIPGIQYLRNLKITVKLTAANGEVVFTDYKKISTNNSIEEIYFRAGEAVLPGKIDLILKTEAKLPFVIKATLFRIEDIKDPEVEGLQLALMFRRFSRRTSWRRRAYEAGMIRPFLLLASMDSVTRHHVARLLGITLANSKLSDGDPHAETYKILFRKNIGLKPRTELLFEKMKGAHSDWYNCVQRASQKLKKNKDESKDLKMEDTLAACQIPGNQLMEDLEKEFLIKLFDKALSKLADEDKVLLGELMNTKEAITIVEALKDLNYTQDSIHKLAVLIIQLQSIKMEQLKAKEEAEKEERKKKEMEKKKKKKKKKEESNEENQPENENEEDTDANTNDDGLYSPFTTSDKVANTAFQTARMAALVAAKFIIFAINPFLCFGVGVVFMFAEMKKSNHGLVFLVVTQLLLRKLLLATKRISLDHYLTIG